MEALDNKCPSCSSQIVFNPANQTWDCTYCGGRFTLDEINKNNLNSNNSGNLNLDVYKCSNCGAEIMADETTTATFCVYCGSSAVLKEKINDGRCPDFIIPFKVVKDDAILSYKKFTKFKPLLPRCFKSKANVEKITGVYVPFWAYDLEISGGVDFEGVDKERWHDDEYDYVKFKKYLVKTEGKFDFDKVLADASSKFSDDMMDSLEPFDYQQITNYNHMYLSGYLADKYDIFEDAGLERVAGRSRATAISLLENTVRHDSNSVVDDRLNVINKKTHYIYLPVWMLNIKYKDKTYTFAVNGQTGKFVGDLPIGVLECVIWGLGLFILFYVIAMLGLKFL